MLLSRIPLTPDVTLKADVGGLKPPIFSASDAFSRLCYFSDLTGSIIRYSNVVGIIVAYR